jgi:hypothetical protein
MGCNVVFHLMMIMAFECDGLQFGAGRCVGGVRRWARRVRAGVDGGGDSDGCGDVDVDREAKRIEGHGADVTDIIEVKNLVKIHETSAGAKRAVGGVALGKQPRLLLMLL